MFFKDILGHTREVEALKKAILNNRVAHAYLFSGGSGIGKGCVARAFTAALNCKTQDAFGCGACEDCQLIENSTHPNLVEIGPTDKDGERSENGLIRIARIRELQGAIKYRIDRGKKVAIVEAADTLVPAAANAFLKTLEEPPSDSVIILISSRASYLLPTILSRCQRINFRPLPQTVVKDFLVRREGLSSEEAEPASRLSAGSIPRALEYAGSGLHEKRREIAGCLTALGHEDTGGLLKLAEELSKRDDLTEVLELMKVWCRDLLVSSEGAAQLAIDNDAPGVAKGGAGSTRSAGTGDLLKAFSLIEQARYDTTPPRYGNKQLAMEVLLMRLAECGVIA